MEQVTVFVDDAVLGHLPPICMKDGVPTDDHVVLRTQVGGRNGLEIAWLLLLAGPLGWLGLLLYATSHRPADTLTVQLPLSAAAFQRVRDARRESWIGGGFAVVLAVTALIAFARMTFEGRFLGASTGALCLAALTWWILGLRRVHNSGVDVELDASRRWVTLSRVHANFVQSVFQRRNDFHPSWPTR
jgi:hypothetical protein